MARSYSRERAFLRDAANSGFDRQRDVLESAGKLLGNLTQLAGRKLVQKTPLRPKKSGIGGFIGAGACGGDCRWGRLCCMAAAADR